MGRVKLGHVLGQVKRSQNVLSPFIIYWLGIKDAVIGAVNICRLVPQTILIPKDQTSPTFRLVLRIPKLHLFSWETVLEDIKKHTVTFYYESTINSTCFLFKCIFSPKDPDLMSCIITLKRPCRFF